jgi:ABC-type nickel/cobalt efflux system permease component RcnA
VLFAVAMPAAPLVFMLSVVLDNRLDTLRLFRKTLCSTLFHAFLTIYNACTRTRHFYNRYHFRHHQQHDRRFLLLSALKQPSSSPSLPFFPPLSPLPPRLLTCTRAHTHIHTRTHTHTHTRTHTRTHTHARAHTHTCARARTQVRTDECIRGAHKTLECGRRSSA